MEYGTPFSLQVTLQLIHRCHRIIRRQDMAHEGQEQVLDDDFKPLANAASSLCPPHFPCISVNKYTYNGYPSLSPHCFVGELMSFPPNHNDTTTKTPYVWTGLSYKEWSFDPSLIIKLGNQKSF